MISRLLFGFDLDGIGRDETACERCDDAVDDIEARHDLATAVGRRVDLGAADGDEAPKQPNLLAFSIGVGFACRRGIGSDICLGGHTRHHGGGEQQWHQNDAENFCERLHNSVKRW